MIFPTKMTKCRHFLEIHTTGSIFANGILAWEVEPSVARVNQSYFRRLPALVLRLLF